MTDDPTVSVGEGSTEQATRPLGIVLPWRPFTTPERFGEIESTNSELLRRAASGAPEGTVLLADSQSAGRGRFDRRWLDHPSGSVLCSMLFRPAWPVEYWFLAGWVVALSAIEACSEATGVECLCKWPNDLIAGDEHRKVAGVLAEAAPGALVVGIGINCNWPAGFPPAGVPGAAELATRATSLDRLAGKEVDRDLVSERMLAAVSRRWAGLKAAEHASGREEPPRRAVAALGSEYRSVCGTIGQLIRVTLPGEEFTGRAVDVDASGQLLVDVGACIRVVDSGDVIHVRSGGVPGAD